DEYGALGTETEYRYPLTVPLLPDLLRRLGVLIPEDPGEAPDMRGEVLAEGPGIKIALDTTPFWRDPATQRLYDIGAPQVPPGSELVTRYIPEVVVDPAVSIPGERRQTLAEAEAKRKLIRDRLARTAEWGGPIPLRELLEDLPGWEITELGQGVIVDPPGLGYDGRSYHQPTLGTPAFGFRAAQDHALGRLSAPYLLDLFVAGRQAGQRSARRLVTRIMGGDKVPARFLPFLSVIPDVDEVWGYAWQMFNQAAAQPATKPPQLFKNMLPLPLRHALDSARRALRPDTRGFLDEDHDALSKLVHDELTALMRRYFRRYKPGEAVPDGFFDRAVGDMLSPREQVTAALTGRTSQGRQTTPSETLGMAEFPLDTDSARLAVALLLGEFRALAVAADGPLMTEEQIEQTDAELAALGERLYRRAVAASVPLPPEELRRSVQRILDNRVVRDFSRFLRLAVEGVPHVDGAPRRLLT
ncbi:hypothetical protein, partial [Streptomyces milbemycinicus]